MVPSPPGQGAKTSEPCSASRLGLVCQGLGPTKTSVGPAGWNLLPLQGFLEGAKSTSRYPAPRYRHSECHAAEEEIPPGTARSGLAAASVKKRPAKRRALPAS